jgi:hypothetical protein
MSNTYALYIEPDVPNKIRVALVDLIKTDNRIKAWWNHVPSLYLLTSDCNAATLSSMIGEFIKPWTFFVIKVDPEDSQGWMPERAWDWILRRQIASDQAAKSS